MFLGVKYRWHPSTFNWRLVCCAAYVTSSADETSQSQYTFLEKLELRSRLHTDNVRDGRHKATAQPRYVIRVHESERTINRILATFSHSSGLCPTRLPYLLRFNHLLSHMPCIFHLRSNNVFLQCWTWTWWSHTFFRILWVDADFCQSFYFNTSPILCSLPRYGSSPVHLCLITEYCVHAWRSPPLDVDETPRCLPIFALGALMFGRNQAYERRVRLARAGKHKTTNSGYIPAQYYLTRMSLLEKRAIEVVCFCGRSGLRLYGITTANCESCRLECGLLQFQRLFLLQLNWMPLTPLRTNRTGCWHSMC